MEPHEECSVKGYYWTALHYACHFGAKDILAYLCSHVYKNYPEDFNEIINVTTKEGWTPLMISAIYNQTACTEVLLKAGGQKLQLKDNNNRTASNLANFYGWTSIANTIDSQMGSMIKENSATAINAEFLNRPSESLDKEVTTSGTTASIMGTEDGDIEFLDQFYDLLKFGTRLPCLICQLETGWIQYTKCCGQPLHYFCTGSKLKTCPNCNCSELELIYQVRYPERAFSIEN